jgi:hypothetical protein
MSMKLKDLAEELMVSINTVVSILNRHGVPRDSFNDPMYTDLMRAIYLRYGPFENAYTAVKSFEGVVKNADELLHMNLHLKDKLLEAYEKLEGGK